MTGTNPLLALDSASQNLLFRQAHTANAFADGPVSDETVREIHELVRSVPTASGGQPLRVVLVRSAAGRERLLRHMSRGNQEKTALAPLVAVLAVERSSVDTRPRPPWSAPPRPSPAPWSATIRSPTRHVWWATTSSTPNRRR